MTDQETANGRKQTAGRETATGREQTAGRETATGREQTAGRETATGREQTAGPVEGDPRAPDSPAGLPRRSWKAVLAGTLKEFKRDELTDRGAALTYYGILALFPALLALVSLLGIAGQSATQQVLANIQNLAPGAAREVLRSATQQIQGNAGLGSVTAIVGLVLAVWAASGYVAAFIRSANVVYDVPEGRPVWKVLPVRVGVTVVLLILAVISALIVVFTGTLAQKAGTAMGAGDTVLTVWSIAKWPVLVLLVTIMIAILYKATPNARIRGFRWITPGSLLALLLWMIASAAFALYVANFASYNQTYGTLAGMIIFLVWLWITNLAILLGLEFDAELARQRAVAGGHPAGREPYVEPRDTRQWDAEDRRRMDKA